MVRDTSIQAYQTIEANGLLSEMRWNTYDCLYRHGPMTSSELDERMKKEGTLTRRSSQPRLHELRERGCVRELDKVLCSITGLTVIQWDVTSNLPAAVVNSSVNPTKAQMHSAHQWLRAVTDFYCYGRGSVPPDVQAVLVWLGRKGL